MCSLHQAGYGDSLHIRRPAITAGREGVDHAWRERPLRRRARPQCRRPDEPRRPIRAALWAMGSPTVFTIPARYTQNLIRAQSSLAQSVARGFDAMLMTR